MQLSIWTGMFYEASLRDALEILSGCGWRAFEISDEHLVQLEQAADADRQIETTVAYAAEQGLVMPQAHAFLSANIAQSDAAKREADLRRVEKHLALAARLGCRNVVLHPGSTGNAAETAELARTRRLNRESLRRLGDAAGGLGLRIGLENLMDQKPLQYARRYGSTAGEILELLADAAHPALGITLDTSHANVMGLNVAQVVRDFGAKLIATHISDNDGSGDQHLIPGYGKLDWTAIIAAFREIGYAGIFNLEIPGARHANPEICRFKARQAREMTAALLEK